MKALLIALLFITPAFEWDADRKLQWSDFEGVYDSSDVSASTCSEISMEMLKDKEGGAVFIVKAIFHPEKSFVSPTCSKSLKALQHEQLHFDITEVYARKLRTLLHTMQHTHNQANIEIAGYFYDINRKQWDHAQSQYDLESEHSENDEAQKQWERIVKIALNKSIEYGNKSNPGLCCVH